METWAAGKAFMSKVLFLMVCVNGDKTSESVTKDFARRYKLQAATFGYIDNRRELPTFGQLGCQGFIVLDTKGNVVTLRSQAFMKVRQQAFKEVEGWLITMIGQCFEEGTKIKLHGLSRPDFNGLVGVVRGYDVIRARYHVQLDGTGEKTVAIKEENLVRQRKKNAVAAAQQREKIAIDGSEGETTDIKEEHLVHQQKDGGSLEDVAQQEIIADDTKDEGSLPGMCACLPATDPNNTEWSLAKELPKVGVPAMDKEHQDLIEAVNLAGSELSLAALRALYSTMESHFESEEALFKKYNFANHNLKEFSGTKSHCYDHASILTLLYNELHEDAWRKRDCSSKIKLLSEVASRLKRHAEEYDSHYSTFFGHKRQPAYLMEEDYM